MEGTKSKSSSIPLVLAFTLETLMRYVLFPFPTDEIKIPLSNFKPLTNFFLMFKSFLTRHW